MRLVLSLATVGTLSLLCAACDTLPKTSLTARNSIEVDRPEIYDNAQLQTQLETLRSELAAIGIVETATLTGALGTVQGTSLSQSNFSLQALGRAGPTVVTTLPSSSQSQPGNSAYTIQSTQTGATPQIPVPSSATPATAALPAFSADAIGMIDKQMQLESQLQGYQLLLGGSDFARYTIDGLAKDKIVIGFPISIYPQPRHRNMAAEVELTYFPPNANQFIDPATCSTNGRFSPGDEVNSRSACQQQEAAPTIVNILPAERSYNVVGIAQSSKQFGAAALIGTVAVGASGGTNQVTQYLVAQQDTLALQGNGEGVEVTCPLRFAPKSYYVSPSDTVTMPSDSSEPPPRCIAGSRGVRFRWQFRPVLGEPYVRPGRRITFVQLAIPNVRRPYPAYGGIVYVRTRWRPFDKKTGIVTNARLAQRPGSGTPAPLYTVATVLGHTFVASDVSSIQTADLGGGSILVRLKGSYLTGATIHVGGTTINSTAPGFIADYNSLQFATTVQALAQSGAVLVSAEGVESPIDLSSVCKSWDRISECALGPPEDNSANRLKVAEISVLPESDATSLVRIRLDRPSLQITRFVYRHYKRDRHGDSTGNLQTRTFDLDDKYVVASDTRGHDASQEDAGPDDAARLEAINLWPIVVTVGGKAYGLSDLPLRFALDSRDHLTISLVASNDALKASPLLDVQRLFDIPADDSGAIPFVAPGSVTVRPDSAWIDAEAKNDKEKAKLIESPCVRRECHYVLAGAAAGSFRLSRRRYACGGAAAPDAGVKRGVGYLGLTIPQCAQEIRLHYEGLTSKGDIFRGTLVVPIGAAAAAPGTSVVQSGALTPHFTLSRAVDAVSDSDGLATLEVGIRNLKDQSAIVSVSDADIVAARDGAGNALPVQAGNTVTVYQDTSLTLQLRNYAKAAVYVTAEGRNGTVSSGKLTFATPFRILPSHRAAESGAAGKSSS